MFSSSTLRKFILGNGNFILSHAEYKRVLLTGQLCTLTFFFGIGFFLFDVYRFFYLMFTAKFIMALFMNLVVPVWPLSAFFLTANNTTMQLKLFWAFR